MVCAPDVTWPCMTKAFCSTHRVSPDAPLDGSKLPEPPNMYAMKARAIKASRLAAAYLDTTGGIADLIRIVPVAALDDTEKKWLETEADVKKASAATWRLVASLVEDRQKNNKLSEHSIATVFEDL